MRLRKQIVMQCLDHVQAVLSKTSAHSTQAPLQSACHSYAYIIHTLGIDVKHQYTLSAQWHNPALQGSLAPRCPLLCSSTSTGLCSLLFGVPFAFVRVSPAIYKMDDVLDSLVGDSRRAVPGLLKNLQAQRTLLEDRVCH